MHKANGCWSEPATGTYSVLPLPEAPIIEMKASCSNNTMLPLILTQSNSGVEWKKDSTLAQNLGNLASFTPTASVLTTDTSTTFFVRYNNGSCWSPYGTAQYVYIEQPLAPQVSTKAICLGDDNIEPLVAVGSLNTTWFDAQDNTLGTGRTLDLNTYPLENSGTYIFKLNNTKYTNLVADMACPSETTTASLIVSSIPNGKVWGKKMVCENSVQNAYYVQELEGDSTTFVWSISGNHTNYTISNEQNKAYRLVDWDYQGKELVKVKVVNKYGCSSSDSMEVTIAVKPDAQFLWSLPGAAYKAKFENLSTQAPVYFIHHGM
ncbi:MAG: hypothetical protein IPO21_20695 [Bacteroidales bacterium]|nr:hypothetical protein [Bacteroidales bacterium]